MNRRSASGTASGSSRRGASNRSGVTGIAGPRSVAGADPDRHIADGDHLARADLAGLAQFGLAVDLYIAAGDDHISGAAAVADADQLEQLVELDVFAVEIESDCLH